MTNANDDEVVIVARPARCLSCGAPLRAGESARLAGQRRLACLGCPAPAAPDASAGVILAAPALLRGNDTAWLAAGILVAGAAALRSPTVRRVARTAAV